MKRLFVFVIAVLAVQLEMSPARAHITDPPHSLWMVGLSPDDQKVAPGENLQLTGTTRFTAPTPLPPPGWVFFSRSFDMVFPDGFNITYAYIGSGECVVQSNTAHCTAQWALQDGQGDSLTFVATTPSVAGIYQATLTTTAYYGGTPSTDSDSVAINLVPRRTADLAWTTTPTIAIKSGQPTTLKYVLTNTGPDAARDVWADFSLTADSFDALQGVSPAGACQLGDGPTPHHVWCAWAEIASLESKSITVTAYDYPQPSVETGQFRLDVATGSYENDPEFGNNYGPDSGVPTYCRSFIDPTATVDPAAKIADKGCTFVGPGTVVKKGATVGKGAIAMGGTIGESAKLSPESIFEGNRYALQGVMGSHSALGATSALAGVIEEYATVGDKVQADGGRVAWMIVERRAAVGSMSRVSLPRPWEQKVRILAGARVPDGTVIDEVYCQRHPKICVVF